MIRIIFCTAILVFSATQITPQEKFLKERTPEWLIEMFFTKNSFTEKEKYYTGEMSAEVSSKSIGEELTSDAQISYYLILDSENKKAYRVVLFVDSKSPEFYIYLTKLNAEWKIEAVRKFLLPKFISDAKDSLLSLSNLEPEDSSLLKLLSLLTASDSELKNYLIENLGYFTKLLNYFHQDNISVADKLMKELNLNGIFKDENYPGSIFFQIGSFEGRELGFIYDQENAVIPKISQLNFIIVEEVIAGWYLYRLI